MDRGGGWQELSARNDCGARVARGNDEWRTDQEVTHAVSEAKGVHGRSLT